MVPESDAEFWKISAPYPSGSQCVVISGTNQSISQILTLSEGNYNLTFSASSAQNNANQINVLIIDSQQNQLFTGTFTPSSNSWQTASFQINLNSTINNPCTLLIAGGGEYSQGTTPPSTAIQNIQIINNTTLTSPSYTYEECQQAAIENGSQYFALQDVNTETSVGYCAVSNNIVNATSLGEAYVPTGQTALWSSNTGTTQTNNPGATASLTNEGSLSVFNSSGTVVFSTPNTNAQPSNYLGCYGDGPTRAMSFFNNGAQEYDLQQCQQLAQNQGSTYFALQNSSSGTTAQCAYSSNWAQTSQYGTAGNCTQLSNGTWSGGGYSNAVYNTTAPSSNYCLILYDNGNMVINRGTGPNDNQGQIWASNTTAQMANPAYAATNGKYGQNWITQGTTLAAGDFVGSPSGYLALIMQSDGNLVLYTFDNASNCQQMADGNQGGGQGANAIYNLGEAGNPALVKNLAYIDQNAELHPYPSSNSQYTNEYTSFAGFDNSGNNISGLSYTNATVSQCQNTCNTTPSCAGFTFNTSTNTCYPKNSSMYPNSQMTTNPNSVLYMRNETPSTPPNGVPFTTNNVTSVDYANYVNGGPLASDYGVSTTINMQQPSYLNAQQNLNQSSQQMATLNTSLDTDNYDVIGQALKNMDGLNNYTDNLLKTKKQIQYLTDNNMNNIVEDSDIVVLQENYNYLFWSILATGCILVSMNVIK